MPLLSEVIARRCVVTGRVQGVGFRWWAQRAANDLGLSGRARNLGDGSVEVLVQGPTEAVVRLLDLLRMESPGMVSAVEVEEVPADSHLDGFEIKIS